LTRAICVYKNYDQKCILVYGVVIFNAVPIAVTKGKTYKIGQDHVRYDVSKFCFSNRVRTLWNSLPDTVVKAESVNSFKGRLDRFWNDQEVKYNWKADIKGTGSRSNLV